MRVWKGGGKRYQHFHSKDNSMRDVFGNDDDDEVESAPETCRSPGLLTAPLSPRCTALNPAACPGWGRNRKRVRKDHEPLSAVLTYLSKENGSVDSCRVSRSILLWWIWTLQSYLHSGLSSGGSQFTSFETMNCVLLKKKTWFSVLSLGDFRLTIRATPRLNFHPSKSQHALNLRK